MTSRDALGLLFAGYLNLDWSEDYDDVWSAVRDFVESEPSAGRIPYEVRVLLAEGHSEEELRRIVVDELGCGYLPEADGWRYDGWLAELCARVAELTTGDL